MAVRTEDGAGDINYIHDDADANEQQRWFDRPCACSPVRCLDALNDAVV
jgi:hypothetical protein